MKTSRRQNVVRKVCGLWVVMALSAVAQTTIVRVPTLGGTEVDVRALNNIGAVVGVSRTAEDLQHAYHYQGGVILDLGTLPGGSASFASGLNDVGHVIGDSDTLDTTRHAWLWHSNSMVDIGLLPGGTESSALSVNNAGDVVGWGDAADGMRGFLFRNGQLTDIGSLGSGFSFVSDMNALGHIVGESWTQFGEQRAYLFRDGMMTNLGTLGGSGSRALAINDSGSVVGESNDTNENTHPFLYSNGSMQDLGTLGGIAATAFAINNLGDVLGDSLTANNNNHAFLYRGGVMLDLGTLGGAYSTATGLNNRGHVIGYAEDDLSLIVPFLWRDGQMVDLNTLLPPDSGWTLETVYFINDADQIVGYGNFFDGQQNTLAWYILTVRTANQPPVANAGPDQFVECSSMTLLDGSLSSDPDGDPMTLEWREGITVLGYGQTLSVNLGLGTHVITVTVRDSQDGSADDSVTIVVRDTTPPSVACPGTYSVSADANCQGVVPDLTGLAVVLDSCTASSALVKSQEPVAGTVLGLGTHLVRISVQDASGNVGHCDVAFSVVDTTPPTGDCPPAMTVSAGPECLGVVPNFAALLVASDNCTPSANLVKTQTPAAGTRVGRGSHTVTLVVTDAAGNGSMCVTTLHVVDSTPPVVTCPAGMTAEVHAECLAAVPDFTAKTLVTDNCSRELVVTQSPAAGTLLGLGTYVVTLSATDDSGNRGSCTTTLTVVDRTAPVITDVSVSPNVLTDANRNLVPITVSVSAMDNCDGAPVARILSITSDEPVVGPTDNTSPDWIVGTGLTAQVRAEASKKGDGRVYTITVVCTDASGNSSTATTTVFVPGRKNNDPKLATLSAGVKKSDLKTEKKTVAKKKK
jgi:probable HAF family extracellular repeat protein